MNRRQFINTATSTTCAALSTGLLFSLLASTKKNPSLLLTDTAKNRGFLRPPGSLNEKDFLSHCIRCQTLHSSL